MDLDLDLIDACRTGDINRVTKIINTFNYFNILNKNTNMDINYIQDNYTALMMASEYGHYECVKKLIEAGAKPDIQDKYGYTSLIITCLYGHESCLKELLEAGADPNIKNNPGDIALTNAIEIGNINCIKLLLKAGSETVFLSNTFKSWYCEDNILESILGYIKIKDKNIYKNIVKLFDRIKNIYILNDYYKNSKFFTYNLIRELSKYL